MYDFPEAIKQWSSPPVDDVGYIPSTKVLEMSDKDVIAFTEQFERIRYRGWRNVNGMYRSCLGLDSIRDKTILDFGCGYGIDGLQFARNGNKVILADISEHNLAAAGRIFDVHNIPYSTLKVIGSYPYFVDLEFDVFYASGVLHHTPAAGGIMRRVHNCMYPNGEVRLFLYSDEAWKRITKSSPTNDTPKDPMFRKFVKGMDGVGCYSDWYNKKKVRKELGQNIFRLTHFNYIAGDLFVVARMVKK